MFIQATQNELKFKARRCAIAAAISIKVAEERQIVFSESDLIECMQIGRENANITPEMISRAQKELSKVFKEWYWAKRDPK